MQISTSVGVVHVMVVSFQFTSEPLICFGPRGEGPPADIAWIVSPAFSLRFKVRLCQKFPASLTMLPHAVKAMPGKSALSPGLLRI
jgi:hypothetical protein